MKENELKFSAGEYEWAQKVQIIVKKALDDTDLGTRGVCIDHLVQKMDNFEPIEKVDESKFDEVAS